MRPPSLRFKGNTTWLGTSPYAVPHSQRQAKYTKAALFRRGNLPIGKPATEQSFLAEYVRPASEIICSSREHLLTKSQRSWP